MWKNNRLFKITVLAALASLLSITSLTGQKAQERLSEELTQSAKSLQSIADLDALIEMAVDKKVVLLGEGSHGTHEFYHWRDQISRRLIEESGYSFIAVEGDWSAILHFDRYVRDLPGAANSAREALMKIDRWPLWMWANEEVAELGEWLREHNSDLPDNQKVGFHGIDIYGMWDSLAQIQEFYREHLPEQADEVKGHYEILNNFSGSNQAYVQHVYRLRPSAEDGVAKVAEKLRSRYANASGSEKAKLFKMRQHAKVVKHGEMHLREMTRTGAHSWNARATHFEKTLHRLLEHYGPNSKGIIWAHNTHIGDARATSMGRSGQVNIGQLARERHGAENVLAVGFGTGTGQVLAGSRWEGPRQTMQIPTPPSDSLESIMLAIAQQKESKALWWIFERGNSEIRNQIIPHRAIGVVYDPAQEQRGNFVPTRLGQRYDAFIFFQQTKTLDPLNR
jgi:erythromycin esterase-like protein